MTRYLSFCGLALTLLFLSGCGGADDCQLGSSIQVGMTVQQVANSTEKKNQSAENTQQTQNQNQQQAQGRPRPTEVIPEAGCSSESSNKVDGEADCFFGPGQCN